MIVYDFGLFRLIHDLGGETITHYEDGMTSGCGIIEEDHLHAQILHISPAKHRLHHELAHHLIGLQYYKESKGSPVIWRDAHHQSQCVPDRVRKNAWSEAKREEWLVTWLQYASRSKEDLLSGEYIGAPVALAEEKVDIALLIKRLNWLLEAREMQIDGLTIYI